MPARKYLVSDVALQCNCSNDLIRKLEKSGQIPLSRRTKNNFRYYNETELKQIKDFFLNRKKSSKWDRVKENVQGKLFDV